jgi:hypothetical protein
MPKETKHPRTQRTESQHISLGLLSLPIPNAQDPNLQKQTPTKSKTPAQKQAKQTATTNPKANATCTKLLQRLVLIFFGFLPIVILNQAPSRSFLASFSSRLRCCRAFLSARSCNICNFRFFCRTTGREARHDCPHMTSCVDRDPRHRLFYQCLWSRTCHSGGCRLGGAWLAGSGCGSRRSALIWCKTGSFVLDSLACCAWERHCEVVCL